MGGDVRHVPCGSKRPVRILLGSISKIGQSCSIQSLMEHYLRKYTWVTLFSRFQLSTASLPAKKVCPLSHARILRFGWCLLIQFSSSITFWREHYCLGDDCSYTEGVHVHDHGLPIFSNISSTLTIYAHTRNFMLRCGPASCRCLLLDSCYSTVPPIWISWLCSKMAV